MAIGGTSALPLPFHQQKLLILDVRIILIYLELFFSIFIEPLFNVINKFLTNSYAYTSQITLFTLNIKLNNLI